MNLVTAQRNIGQLAVISTTVYAKPRTCIIMGVRYAQPHGKGGPCETSMLYSGVGVAVQWDDGTWTPEVYPPQQLSLLDPALLAEQQEIYEEFTTRQRRLQTAVDRVRDLHPDRYIHLRAVAGGQRVSLDARTFQDLVEAAHP